MALQKPRVRRSSVGVGLKQKGGGGGNGGSSGNVNSDRRRSATTSSSYTSAQLSSNNGANNSNNNNNNNSSSNLSVASGNSSNKQDQTRMAIERMEAEREARRAAFENQKKERADEERRIREAGNTGDVDFIGMVQAWRDEHQAAAIPYEQTSNAFGSTLSKNGSASSKICICVRKRPVSNKEIAKKDHDCITILHPTAWIHVPKHRVDGITKYLDHTSFAFDYTFCENSSTEDVYHYTTLPLVEEVVAGKGCRATVFAYGQTGSGKTHTMSGIQSRVVDDLFDLMCKDAMDDFFDEHANADNDTNTNLDTNTQNDTVQTNFQVTVSFFEIYGVRIQDLLNNRKQLKILEDGKGEVVVSGLEEFEADTADSLLDLMEQGNELRTTHATEANDTSSRSHAICQIMLRDRTTGSLRGKLSLVDLAGSERGADTKSHNRQRRTESSEINKSLLALKECIRALDSDNAHVPYRSSKLTLVLKDCFTSPRARTTMIATLAPGSTSADHSINTLRYADRVKEQKVTLGTFNLSTKPLASAPLNTTSTSSFSRNHSNHSNPNITPATQRRKKPSPQRVRSVSPPRSPSPTQARPLAATIQHEQGPRRYKPPNARVTTLQSPLRSPSPVPPPAASTADPHKRRATNNATKITSRPLTRSQTRQTRNLHHSFEKDEDAPHTTLSRTNVQALPSASSTEIDYEYEDDNDDGFEPDEEDGEETDLLNDDDDPDSFFNSEDDDLDAMPVQSGTGSSDEDDTILSSPDSHTKRVRHASQLLHQHEEDLLNMHMTAIHETADMLKLEVAMINRINRENSDGPSRHVTVEEMTDYLSQLKQLLHKKVSMVAKVQDKIEKYEKHQEKQKELNLFKSKAGRETVSMF